MFVSSWRHGTREEESLNVRREEVAPRAFKKRKRRQRRGGGGGVGEVGGQRRVARSVEGTKGRRLRRVPEECLKLPLLLPARGCSKEALLPFPRLLAAPSPPPPPHPTRSPMCPTATATLPSFFCSLLELRLRVSLNLGAPRAGGALLHLRKVPTTLPRKTARQLLVDLRTHTASSGEAAFAVGMERRGVVGRGARPHSQPFSF